MKRLKTAGAGAGGGAQLGGGRGRGHTEISLTGGNGRLLVITALVLVTMLITLGFARAAAAAAVEEFNIVIPIDTIVFAPEGSTTVLATESVGEEFAGQVCTVATRSENQESVHPGNDLTVASGGSLVTLNDVEGTAGGVVVAEDELALGSEIVVSLIMGPDEVFSAGFALDVVCMLSEATTTTTIAATTTTTMAATTTTGAVGPTSVTSPPEETTSTVEDSVGGTVITTSTVADEVEDLEVLPFTGSHDTAWLFLLGSGLALAGILVVGSKREDTE